MTKVKLIARDLEMSFGARRLFKADALSLCQGDVIYLQGDNGTGKSTLMKILAGLMAPTKGKIETVGFAKNAWWRRNPLLGKAVYLHQHPYLFDGTVEYNLTYGLNFSSETKAKAKQRITQAIEMAQLGSLLHARASNLSGGERQRLAIARAWILQPKLLMLDEPTSNMDKDSQELVLKMIQQLKHEGTGMLLSSHQNCALTSICEQQWHIKGERVTTAYQHPESLPAQESLYVIAN
ncbi:energy-coupling factor ABC transporter ATP-binding protein [Shewanella baltica]|uniref:ABC transporter ATP-binding protein n=1 Tax=Shewanella baltica TaxID=62322 RepID=UPI00217EC6BB|nr:energy-coupling factor ABC transporter ATP-binding protein [Shewanella baltica]MCS6129124.1 energy-coupling factor ABC transporter ATP-binding protein [Shewanella baltica]MCS6141054.1 energy-coupling factor ABC transporter ATP-binding protein [Shewanella baltica]MCS6147338.1 energy-coupling factor ABC transporter ATP-binding protein [Shewanella baltica]MCS6171865.1 energy-coupling factor ABC transporter ATP-binding protein [Shewanella baltica]MCS6189092.1 energy-coupling factor ABC transpor